MELWIRSQDKEKILKVNDIAIEMNKIYGYFDKNTEYEHLGTYATKERALEVLDEIQSIILLQSMYKYDNKELMKAWSELSQEEIKNLRTQISVYKMPKE